MTQQHPDATVQEPSLEWRAIPRRVVRPRRTSPVFKKRVNSYATSNNIGEVPTAVTVPHAVQSVAL